MALDDLKDDWVAIGFFIISALVTFGALGYYFGKEWGFF